MIVLSDTHSPPVQGLCFVLLSKLLLCTSTDTRQIWIPPIPLHPPILEIYPSEDVNLFKWRIFFRRAVVHKDIPEFFQGGFSQPVCPRVIFLCPKSILTPFPSWDSHGRLVLGHSKKHSPLKSFLGQDSKTFVLSLFPWRISGQYTET